MMGNITINIWMILTVILFVGMIAILVSSIYRGIKKCHKRIDEQKNNFEKIDGRIEIINNEITNIKIDQATVRAVQGFDVETRRKEMTTSPIHIYQHPAASSSVYPAVQSVPQPQAQYQAPQKAVLWEEPKPIQQQVSQPTQVAEKQSVEQQAPKAVQGEDAKPVQQIGEAVELQEPQVLHMEEPQHTQQQKAESFQETSQNPVQGEAPIYHQTRIPAIGFTEFQLPEEYDVEDEGNLPLDSEIESEPRPQVATKARLEIKPRPRTQAEPAFIPEKENINPSKFNSLNDGISRTGKQYSEEELSYKILD